MTYLEANNEIFKSLSVLLDDALSGLEKKVTISEGASPVLLLETDMEVVGFGTLGDEYESDYLRTYNEFKRLYKENTKKWTRLNISFVLCRPGSKILSPEAERFFNKIETDVYFCRKFVVPTSNMRVTDLGRLPFIPIDKSSVAPPKRPFSAQSLMQQLGVPGELAKSLLIANRKSSANIVEDCLKDSKVPEFSSLTEQAFQKTNLDDRSPNRLKSVKLNDFRAYKGSHVFDLDADLVIIYGPNGLGKTSLFDAIDFVSTGGCGRFKDVDGGEDAFRAHAHHLDSDPKDSFVELELVNGSQSTTFKRMVATPLKIEIDKVQGDRKTALTMITGVTGSDFEKRVDSFVNLFRATHLFGQDFQTLTEDFGKTSGLSGDIVSRMLAFQDYVRGDQKINDVLVSIRQRKKSLEAETTPKTLRLMDISQELNGFQASSPSMNTPESLKAWIDLSVSKYHQGTVLPSRKLGESEKEYIRGLRAVLEAFVRKDSDILTSIDSIKNEFSEYQDNRRLFIQADHKLQEIASTISQQRVDIDSKKNDLGEAERLLIEKKSSETTVSQQLQNLQWGKMNLDIIRKDELSISVLNRDRENLSAALKSIESELNLKQNDLNQKSGSQATLNAELKSKVILRNEASKISTEYAGHLDVASQILKVEDSINKLDADIKENIEKGKKIKVDADALISKTDALKADLDIALKSESELNSIIERLKQHVQDPHCPACGADHGSMDLLLQTLSAHSPGTSLKVQSITEEIRSKDEEYNQHQKVMSELRSLILELSNQKKTLAIQLEDMKKTSSAFQQRVAAIGLIYNTDTLEEELDNIVSGSDIHILSIEEKIADLGKHIEGLKSQIIVLNNEVESKKNNLDTLKIQLREVGTRVDVFKSESANRGLLNIEDERFIDGQIANGNEVLTNVRLQIAELEQKLARMRSEHKIFEEKIQVSLKEQLAIASQITSINTILDSFKKKAKVFGLPDDVSFDEVTKLMKEKENESVKNREFLSELLTLETTIDAVEVSNQISRLQIESKSLEDEIKRADAQIELLQRWAVFFDELKDTLSKVKNTSVAEFTDQYGPLSSLIQSRLRTVYGFGEIQLSSGDGAIAVTVKRKDSHLRPIDYFSESQKQILVLSLFFASAITQNWSAFAPIFLDDPVNHFDDLNAYAFLDLISGMLQSEKGRRQFVISTCEEKLYQLMKQKFYNFSSRVLFYEFSAMSENGPVWKPVPNGNAGYMIES